MKDHRLIDQRSLAFGRAVARRLTAAPELVGHARRNLARWRQTCSPRERPALQEWADVIDGPIDGVIALLTSDDERSTRLRQSSPFAGLLSTQERNAILREFQAHDAAST